MKSSKTCKSLKDQKTVCLFLCRSLWIFVFFRFFISLCFSNIFASVIFFCFMCVFEFFGDQWIDSSYSSYILTQISLMLFFRTYRLEMKSSETCKSRKDQKTIILFLCRSLWIFAFCRFFISLCFSNIFTSVIFFWFYVYFWIFLSSINWLFIFFLYFNLDLVNAIF